MGDGRGSIGENYIPTREQQNEPGVLKVKLESQDYIKLKGNIIADAAMESALNCFTLMTPISLYRLFFPPLLAEPERQVHQPDHHRHFHQRTDDGSEGLAGIDAKNRHRHRDSQFEIVAGSGE